MTQLVLVRHGEAAADFDADVDPGLSDRGRAQAAAMLAAIGHPRPLIVSPLRRTRETAGVLESAWGSAARVEPAVGEIPSPDDLDLAGRGAWLFDVLPRRWSELDEGLRAWRTALVDAVRAVDVDTVVVTHFVAINALVGLATGDDRVVVFRPTNCSRTTIELDGPSPRVIELGAEADTVVG